VEGEEEQRPVAAMGSTKAERRAGGRACVQERRARRGRISAKRGAGPGAAPARNGRMASRRGGEGARRGCASAEQGRHASAALAQDVPDCLLGEGAARGRAPTLRWGSVSGPHCRGGGAAHGEMTTLVQRSRRVASWVAERGKPTLAHVQGAHQPHPAH
jgi:hypothetical protein